MEIYRKLFSYVPEKRYLLVMSVLASAVSALLTVGGYYFIYLLLLSLYKGTHEEVMRYMCVLAAFLASAAVIYYLSVLTAHLFAFRLETNLRKRGIEGLSQASFRFFDLHPSGMVRKIIDDNAGDTHTLVAHMVPDNARAFLIPILTTVLAFFVSLRVGLLLLFMEGMAGLLLWRMMGDKAFMKVYQKALETLSAETVEYVRGIQVVKVFRASVPAFRTFYKAIMDYSRYAYRYSQSCKLPYVTYNWLFLGLLAFLVPLSLYGGWHGEGTSFVVDMIMIFFLTGVIFSGIMKVMYVGMYSFQAGAAVDKLEALYEEMKEEALPEGNRETITHFGIDFDHVSFDYGKEKVLSDVSFSLKEGKIYALVGPSGGGKTTIAKLISGFYPVKDGAIRIGGRRIEEYTKEALTSHISFIFQDTKLFKDTIYNNVAVGDPTATEKEIREALSLASCDSLLAKLPKGMETVIGGEEVHLSGGEKQRIAVARAILKKADIIIMDEATASMDPENEHEMQKAFKNLMKGKTVIMIAHRLSAITHVDEILVVDKGQIVERGSDAVLMERNGVYRKYKELYGKASEWRVDDEKMVSK